MKQKIIIGILLLILLGCRAELVEETEAQAGNKYVLENGFTMIVKPNKNTNLAVLDLYIKTGTLTENKPGISYLTARSMTSGTKKYNREQLLNLLENDGGNFEVKPTAQYEEIRVMVPSTAISTGMEFLYEILTKPTFKQEEIAKEKNFILNEIKEKQDNPQAVSDELLYKKVFEGTPYANTVEGTEESLRSITVEDIKEYHKTWHIPNNMVLVVAGNVNEHKLVEAISRTFGSLKKGDIQESQIDFGLVKQGRFEENKFIDAFYINFGYRTVPAQHPDIPKLKVLHGLLGQGPAARLYQELREKQGLAYRLETINPTIKDIGLFKISAITSPDKLEKIIEEIKKQVERTKTEKISEQELQDLKTRIKGYYALFHQLSYDVTEYLGLYEVTGRGFMWDQEFPQAIDMVTAEDIQETARKYLNDPVITIVGPFEEVEIKGVGEYRKADECRQPECIL